MEGTADHILITEAMTGVKKRAVQLGAILLEIRKEGCTGMERASGLFDSIAEIYCNEIPRLNWWRIPTSSIDTAIQELLRTIRASQGRDVS